MRRWMVLGAVAVAAAVVGCASLWEVQPNLRSIVLEHDRVVVKEVILEPGVEYPEHTHDRPHVGVIVRGGTLEFHEGGAVETVEFEPGDAGWRDANVTHRIVNRSAEPVHVVEVELK